ncbi:MAG TPA: MlaD family protein [Solirubrobacterales bacterium]|nr:MlaD family protein [Solirubrobacterales bacterium]
METRPPTITRILVAIGFALSCFALALFLWITFGGPLPLKPEGYRFTVPFDEATQLAEESDVRISGVPVGKVKAVELGDNGLAEATIQLDSRYAPIPADTRAMLRTKTLLGETFVELTPGDAQGPTLEEGGDLPKAQVANSVQLDEIWRTFNARTRSAFRVWMQGTADSVRGRGPDLSAAIAELAPFADETDSLLRVLDSQDQAVRELVHNGGTVFQALSERQGQLRGLIQNSQTVFSTTAQRNQDLEELFKILPTFQRESRFTLERLNRFAHTADPLVQQLRPAARELSPTLVAAQKAAPDLKKFFEGLRGAIRFSDTGFPALRRLLGDDFKPLLSRLGGVVDGQDPYLAHLNSIIQVIGMYKHEVTAFLGNAAAAVQYNLNADEIAGANDSVHILRTTSPLNPETLASFDQRLNSNRANPYFKPLGYNQLASGLKSFANTPCGAGINATLPPRAQVAGDPNFQPYATPDPTFFNPLLGDPGNLYDRIKSYALGLPITPGASSTSTVPAPPCAKQGNFTSVGRSPESTPYLHVRRQP